MANKIYLNSTFAYREDTIKNWQTANPVLERGELSFVRDGFDGKFIKIGDGHTPWNSLPFAPLPKGEKGEQGEKGIDGKDGINGKDGADYVLTEADKEEIAGMVDTGKKEWELIEDITLSEETVAIYFSVDKIKTIKELHIEGYIVPSDTTVTNQAFSFHDGSPLWQANANCKATGYINLIMDIHKASSKQTIFDGTLSVYNYALSGGSFKIAKINNNLSANLSDVLVSDNFSFRSTAANPMTIGTKIKVWGR